jgi:hypothetical protein
MPKEAPTPTREALTVQIAVLTALRMAAAKAGSLPTLRRVSRKLAQARAQLAELEREA